MHLAIIHPDPTLAKYHFSQTPTNHCLGVRDYICSIFDWIDRPNKQELHIFDTPALAVHNSHRTLPAPEPYRFTLRHMCHFCSADLQPQGLIKLQVRNRRCIRTREVRPQITTHFCRQVCRLVKL